VTNVLDTNRTKKGGEGCVLEREDCSVT
jgi:hypothetical protein